ncbi:cysteine synthase family protein [Pseudomonas sp. SDO528_S397]
MKLTDIGNTPFSEIDELSVNGNRFFSKCEFLNPTGSHKDRTYLHIINTLEKAGLIVPGMTLIDCSTGNGGAALAWIGRLKGYAVKIFMPEGMTQERKEQIFSFGAEIIETPKEEFLSGAMLRAQRYSAENLKGKHYFLDQSNTLLNKEAWHACGEEIVKALKLQNVVPDYFVCSIGTGGTFSGIAQVMKRAYSHIRTVGIEVDSSAPLYSLRNQLSFEHRPHNLMGLGAGVLSVNTVSALIDEVRVVDGHDAWARMKRFIAETNFPIGPTCGANLMVCDAISLAVKNKNIVTLFFDSSWKYQSRWNGVYPDYM